MDADSTIRQLKIAMITDTPNEIITFMENLCTELKVVNTNVFNDFGYESVYYITTHKKQPLFYYDDSRSYMLCDFEYIWKLMEKFIERYISSVKETSKIAISVIQFLVDHYLDIKASVVDISFMDNTKQIKDALKDI